MKETWELIEAKLTELSPEAAAGLQPGATAEAIAQLERVLGAELPQDFRAAYQVHNGQLPNSPGLIESEELLSLPEIQVQWHIWKDLLDSNTFENEQGPYTSHPHPGIRNDWWNPLWIPITHDGSGNHYCLDLDPAPAGNRGQIIRMWHDDPERSLEAPSFTAWLTDYKNKLESGQLVYSENYFGIIDKDVDDED